MRNITFPKIHTDNTLIKFGICAATLILAALFGTYASPLWIALIVAGVGAVVLIQWPLARLFALLLAALFIPVEIDTGSEVALNPSVVLLPVLFGLWVLNSLYRRKVRFVPSRTILPLFLFLLAVLFSLLIGIALWDPSVPRSDRFIVVQLAQWALFTFSAMAFWLTGNIVRDEKQLRSIVFIFLVLAGGLAILRVIPGAAGLANQAATVALNRAPFWLVLGALTGGQLLFNPDLSTGWRLYLLAILGATLIFVFVYVRETASYWIGLTAVLGVLAWLRFHRLRWPIIILLVALVLNGTLTSAVYDFVGGDDEWVESGGSRLVLIGRVVEVTMHNPITGLGPAAYRAYAISSHNNYVDIFSHAGLLGLGIFCWFAVEVVMLGLRLRSHFSQGFAAGYVNAMLAAWAGALVIMVLADWILPFVYNIGFVGFQASVLVWLFLGGLVSLEQIARDLAGN